MRHTVQCAAAELAQVDEISAQMCLKSWGMPVEVRCGVLLAELLQPNHLQQQKQRTARCTCANCTPHSVHTRRMM